MSSNRQVKAQKIAVIEDDFQNSTSAIVIDYRGINCADVAKLRAKARQQQVIVKVVSNRLAKRAAQATGWQKLAEHLRGPTLLLLAQVEPNASAILYKDFVSNDTEHEFTVRAVGIDREIFTAEKIAALAAMPNRQQALMRLLAVMQAPVQNYLGVVQAPISKLIMTLTALRNKRQEG